MVPLRNHTFSLRRKLFGCISRGGKRGYVFDPTIDTGWKGSPTRTIIAESAGYTPAHEDIALRAYEKFVERGEGPGDDVSDWLLAEQELQSK